MPKLLLALAALLIGAVPAFAYDTPKALLQAVYAPYFKGEFFDWSTQDESKYRSASLNALFAADAKEAPEGDVGRLDFDPYIDGQDYAITRLKYGVAAITGTTATMDVTFHNFDIAEDMQFLLVKEADGWKIDDVISKSKDNPYSLRAIMSAPLPTDSGD